MVRRYEPLDKLKGRLREQRMTYRELGKRAGLTAATISNKLNGVNSFDLDEAVRIAHILDISQDDFAKYFFVRKVAIRNKL